MRSCGVLLSALAACLANAISADTPAFPTAEGFGKYAIGGRGGRTIAVTTLAASGPGSFREACEASGPRIVVFRVGGIIDLGDEEIAIQNPYITIAGQTAPGDGICFKNARLVVRANHVVIRHVRFRPGDDPEGQRPNSRDALGIGTDLNQDEIGNIVVDHCSISWGLDSNIDLFNRGGRTYNLTVQNCIIAESLSDSIHVDEGKTQPAPHGTAMLVNRDHENISIHHNLFAHNVGRVPTLNETLNPATLIEIANNVFYDWGNFGNQKWGLFCIRLAAHTNFDIVNNYFKKGPAGSGEGHVPIRVNAYSASKPDLARRVYVEGNFATEPPANPATYYLGVSDNDNWRYVELEKATNASLAAEYMRRAKRSSPMGSARWESAQAVFDTLLAHVGASKPKRDASDTRVVEQTKTGTGRMVNALTEIGGYPEYRNGSAPDDGDGDGMPDVWEIARGLNPDSDADSRIIGDSGYSMIETYLNDLAGE